MHFEFVVQINLVRTQKCRFFVFVGQITFSVLDPTFLPHCENVIFIEFICNFFGHQVYNFN